MPFAKRSILNVWQWADCVYVLITAQQFVEWPYVYAASDTFIILAHSGLCFFQVYAGIVNHIRHYQGTYIQAYWDIIKAYSDLFS